MSTAKSSVRADRSRTAGTSASTSPQRRAPAESSPRIGRTGLKLALTLALMGLVGAGAGLGTWSAFSSTTENSGNVFQSGTVVLSDNDGGSSPMLSFVNAKPGDTDTSCMTVSYTGTLPSSVRLYGTTAGTGLDQYMNLVVTRGSGATGFDNCTGFTPDAGGGVVYSGTLQGFADDYATGIDDGEVWTNPESHQYRFVVTVLDNNAAQGLNATQTFTWEARNN